MSDMFCMWEMSVDVEPAKIVEAIRLSEVRQWKEPSCTRQYSQYVDEDPLRNRYGQKVHEVRVICRESAFGLPLGTNIAATVE